MSRDRTDARPGHRRFRLPSALRDALAEVFDVPAAEVERVRIVEHSFFARLHGRHVAATTRVGTIYVPDAGRRFASDPALVLHEYFHVLRQWNVGALTTWRYLRESMRHGYRDNRYEVEARAFARRHVRAFASRLHEEDHEVG